MHVYCFIDVSRKQEFIFRHNRLRDNLTNSYIIKSLTEKMNDTQDNHDTHDTHGTPSEDNSGSEGSNYKAYAKLAPASVLPALTKYVEQCKEAEFVYSGGGNSIVRFANREQADQFVRSYSLAVLKAFPELELYISTVGADSSKDPEKEMEIWVRLIKKADQLKDRRKAQFRRWTYGIEKIDQTGKAIQVKNGQQFSAHEQEPVEEEAKTYLYRKWNVLTADSGFTSVDKLKKYRQDEQSRSYIGVIAIDGNLMGEMIKQVASFKELREFSAAIEEIYFQAVQAALRALAPDERIERFVTPVVMSGDDICLIVRGESAVQLAASIVRHIQDISATMRASNALLDKAMDRQPYLTACAGVAIVKVSYPFYEAIQAAERLCHQAKEQLHKSTREAAKAVEPPELFNTSEASGARPAASFIDWEIIHGQAQAPAYDSHVQHRNDRELFHIKPLRIDQQDALQGGSYGFYPMIELARRLKADTEISASLLESVKKLAYLGKEAYIGFFKTNQMAGADKLKGLMREYVPSSSPEAPVVQSEDSRSITYPLHDLLDILPFIGEQEGDY